MENFFYDDHFCSGLEDLAVHLDFYSAEDIPEGWSCEVALAVGEPIFQLTANDLQGILCDVYSERMPEESDYVDEQILQAIKASIDFEKLNAAIPTIYYLNSKSTDATITREDMLDVVESMSSE